MSRQRLWDGHQWTDEVKHGGQRPADATEPPSSEPPSDADSGPHNRPLASPGRRLAARVIDALCLLAVLYLITSLSSRYENHELSEVLSAQLDSPLILLVPLFLWEFVPQAFTGRTLGKALLGIRIVRRDDSIGNRFLAAFIRSIGAILLLLPLIFLISCITIFRKRRRTIPDMLAGTSVVKVAPGPVWRLVIAILVIMILTSSVGYGYLEVWQPAARIGNEWESLESFDDADQVRAEVIADTDISDYDFVVLRKAGDTSVWDIVFFTGDSEDETALMDELWDDFLMVDCYWHRDGTSGSPGVAFDWPQLTPSGGTDVELSWRASTGASGQAVGLMNYESQDVGGAWIATADLTEDGIRNDLRESGRSPEELDRIPIIPHDFYEALLEADSITLTAGATSNTWNLPEDSSSLRSLVERCEDAGAQDSSLGGATSSKEESSDEASTGDSLPGGVDPSDRSATSACEFSDRSAAVRGAVFQVFAGGGIGTAFYVGNDEWITAAHVVENQRSVVLRNGATELLATVKGGDLVADLALLEATGDGIAALRFGSLEEVGAGTTVFAVGFPLYEATESSVTSGVLSRVEQYSDLGEVIVTDASVNPGNSGGPLVDACGDVIGMIIEKYVGTEVEGIGYAVAETTLQDQIPSLRTAGADSVAGGQSFDTSVRREDGTSTPTEEGWFYFIDANIEGGFEAYYLEAVSHSGYVWQDAPVLFLRCSTTASSSNDSIIVWTPFLIFNDYTYDSSTVRYRFDRMAAPFTEHSWWSSEESESWLFAPDDTSFAKHLGRNESGTLFMEFIPGSTVGNVESAEFVVDGASEVLQALDCW